MTDLRPVRFGDLAGGIAGMADGRPPLVLLHGLTYDLRQWGPLVRELAAVDPHRQVLAFDLRGTAARPSGAPTTSARSRPWSTRR